MSDFAKEWFKCVSEEAAREFRHIYILASCCTA
jgi:hypothetical protein